MEHRVASRPQGRSRARTGPWTPDGVAALGRRSDVVVAALLPVW